MSKRNKLYLTVGLLLIGTAILGLVFQKSLWHMYPTPTSPLILPIFGLPLWGFALGAIFNIIPQKGTTYKERYLNTALITMIVITIIFLVPMIYAIFYPPQMPTNMISA